MRTTALMILAGMTISAHGRAQNEPVNAYTLDKEAALGASLDAEIRRQATPIDSEAARNFVNRIGNQLAEKITAAPFPFTFTVIAADWNVATHEPIVVPGGHIFVPAQLILAAKDEAEFAGMLAHAMAHVSGRHYTREATLSAITNQTMIPLVAVGPSASYGAGQNTAGAIPSSSLSLHRDLETESDLMAVVTVAAAGFDPAALVRYIVRTQTAQPGTSGRVFSAFPSPEDRASHMETAIRAMPLRTDLGSGVEELTRVQAEIRPLLALTERPPLDRNPKAGPALKRMN